jgi:hypothetical protein
MKWQQPNERGQPVTNYELVWDNGLGGVPRSLVLQTDSQTFTASTLNVISDLTDGANYLFAVRAKNSIGWGSYSEPTTVMAAAAPSKVPTPVVIQASAAAITI